MATGSIDLDQAKNYGKSINIYDSSKNDRG
jgi:hypothetical protein